MRRRADSVPDCPPGPAVRAPLYRYYAGRTPAARRARDDLARLFNLKLKEDTLAGGLTVTAGTQTIVLSLQQPLASVAGRMISLPAAPVRDGRVWYVPVDFVSRALAPISPIKIDLRKPSRLVIV